MEYDSYNSTQPLMIKYFLTIEHELPVEHASSFTKISSEIQPSLKGKPMFITEGYPIEGWDLENPKKFFSVGIYQVNNTATGKFESGVNAIKEVLSIHKNRKSQKFLKTFEISDELEKCQTVISIVTIVEAGKETFNQEGLPMSLIEGIELLTNFIASLKIKNRYPYDVKYETLNSFVVRTAETLEGTLLDERIISLHQNDIQENEVISIDEFRKTAEFFLRYEKGDPFLRYMEYKLDGINDLNIKGRYSSACMNFGIGAEVLLSFILSFALWEDFSRGQMSKDKAAEILASPLASRVRNEYHGRFGGNWNTILTDWEESVAEPRNRVVHSGKYLSKNIALNSLDSLNSLEKFIFDTLAKKVTHYTRTAWVLLEEEEFRKRNVIKSAQKAKNSLKDSLEIINWLEEYNLWMDDLDPLIKFKMRSKRVSK